MSIGLYLVHSPKITHTLQIFYSFVNIDSSSTDKKKSQIQTLCAHRLWDGAGVAQSIGINRSDNEEVNGVGEEAGHCVLFESHQVCYCLPCIACGLAAGRKKKVTSSLVRRFIKLYKSLTFTTAKWQCPFNVNTVSKPTIWCTWV